MQGSGKNRPANRRRPLLAVPAAIVASLAFAGTASATTVIGGSTALEVKKGLKKKLKKQGVKIKPAAGATKAGRTFSFAITGGDLDRADQNTEPETPSGTVRHDSGIAFTCKGGRVKVTDLIATFTAPSDITGTSKGSQLRLAKLSNLVGSASEDGTHITGAKAKFTNASRKALRRACDVRMKKKKTLGFVHVDAQTVLTVFGGTTSVEPDPSFFAKLAQVQAAPSAVAPATLDATGLHFPVTGGELNPNTLVGQILHSGGLTLNEDPADAPPTTVTVTEPILDLTGPTGGTISMFSVNLQTRAGLFDVAITGGPHIEGNQLTANAELRLTLAAAAALDQELADPDENGGDVFAPGDLVGIGHVTATVG